MNEDNQFKLKKLIAELIIRNKNFYEYIWRFMTDDKQGKKIITENLTLNSELLQREVIVDAYLPVNVAKPENMSLLLINDGQDLPKMPFDEILNNLFSEDKIEPVLCVGIHCGADRKMEYGTARQPDYKGRGAKADAYTNFVFDELLPHIHETYNVPSFKEKSFAGFSLGGLSALDIAWNHPHEFANVGIFSGSLWWRSKGYREEYDDSKHRIMHQQIKKGEFYPWLKFFFECGAKDEKADRNNNGVIDAIDDTLDLVKELRKKGYEESSIKYLELEDGRHDVPTWGKAFPYFLEWAWGKQFKLLTC